MPLTTFKYTSHMWAGFKNNSAVESLPVLFLVGHLGNLKHNWRTESAVQQSQTLFQTT